MTPSLETLPAQPDTAVSPGFDSFPGSPGQPSPSNEPFDSLMNRALSRSPDPDSNRPDPPDKTKPRRDKNPSSSRTGTSSAPQAPPAHPDSQASSAQASANAASTAAAPPGSQPPAPAAPSGPCPKAGAAASATAATPGCSILPGSPTETSAQAAPAAVAKSDSPGATTGAAANPSAADAPVADEQDLLASLSAVPPGAPPAGAGSQAASKLAEIAKNPASTPAPEPLPGAGGISSAQYPVPMQKAEKTTDFTGSAEQKMPAPPTASAGEALPVSNLRSITSMPRSGKSEPAAADSSPISNASSPTEAAPAIALAPESAAPTAARSVERTHDLMALQAVQLRDSGADSLQVVIKPGPGMQMSLDLQMRHGNVEMRATLNQGDFDLLNRHWSQLQQQLESRGVRLAPLSSSEQTGARTGNDGLSQRSNRQSRGDDGTHPGPFAEFAISGAMTPTTAPRAAALRGWESWA